MSEAIAQVSQVAQISESDIYLQLKAIIEAAFDTQQLEKILLSKYKGDVPSLEKIHIRPVIIRQQPQLSMVYHYTQKDITKNYSLPAALTEIAAQLDGGFKQLHVKTQHDDYQMSLSKKGKPSLHHQSVRHAVTTDAPAPSASTTHNRSKQRYVEQSRPFLQQLGVTDQQANIIPAMSRKWKQINKFVEIFANGLSQAGLDQQQTVSVVDFGSGKGYLTFAVHDFIRQQLHKTAQVTGVELRDELVQFCNSVAQATQAEGITFYQGDVRSFSLSSIDVMIALHACDIATDYALHTGIRLGASVIMCAPCCHKEIRPQLKMPQVLQPMLQYGVHLGQQAEMLTDSLRALLLEAHGYETKVFEFVALEHTSKNKMILAIKKPINSAKQAEVLARIEQLKQFYGIEQQSLESLLK
jgi:hypothetical protein